MTRPLNQQTFREQIQRQYKDKSIPVEGQFELTGRCNLNCKMCYIHTQPNCYFTKEERDGDWWIHTIDEACKAGMMFALLTGGECMLHPEFQRIYLHLRSKGVYTRINTNGLLLNQEMIDFFKKNPPLEIQVTLYGTNDDAYEKVTGARVFHQVAAAIMRLKKSGLCFHVAVTPSDYAIGETENIIAYLKANHISHQINGTLITPYTDGNSTRISDREVDIEEKIRYMKAYSESVGKEIPMKLLPPAGGGNSKKVMGLKCIGSKTSCLITWDGFMQTCNMFYNQRLPLRIPGDFMSVWTKLQEQCKEYLIPVECEGCVYKKVCLSCPVLRGGKVGNGHCDPAVCDMTRRLVAAGVKKLPEES